MGTNRRSLSRRDFIAAGLTLTGLTLLDLSCRSAVGPEPTLPGPSPTAAPALPTPPSPASPTPAPTPTTPSPVATSTSTLSPLPTNSPASAPSGPVVGLARKASVAEMVARAVELSGGLKFMKPGAVILVKPNVNSGLPYPATTNPEVVNAVIALLRGKDPGRIILADSSYPGVGAGPDTLGNMRSSGIYDAARSAGAEISDFSAAVWKQIKPEAATHWPAPLAVPTLLDQVDYLVTLPVVKTHFIASYSMALKIMVGLLHSSTRQLLHQAGEPAFGSMIAEANLVRPADLVVLDGTKAFVSGGPDTGQEVSPNLIIATRNPLAADAVGLALLKHLGSTPPVQNEAVSAQPQIRRAIELGLGGPDLTQLQLLSDGVEEVDALRGFLS